jgi:hypothetical protein
MRRPAAPFTNALPIVRPRSLLGREEGGVSRAEGHWPRQGCGKTSLLYKIIRWGKKKRSWKSSRDEEVKCQRKRNTRTSTAGTTAVTVMRYRPLLTKETPRFYGSYASIAPTLTRRAMTESAPRTPGFGPYPDWQAGCPMTHTLSAPYPV